MTAKEYLKQAKTLDMEINAKVEELHQLQLNASCVQSVAITERVMSSHDNSSNKIIDKIVNLQNEINAEIDKLVVLKEEIRSKINQLENAYHRTILTKHFINRQTIEDIAENMNYSRTNTYDMYKSALKAFSKKHFKECTKVY